MYGINREEVVTSFKSEYVIKTLLVQLVKLLTLYDTSNLSYILDCIAHTVPTATGELAGGYDRGKILTS